MPIRGFSRFRKHRFGHQSAFGTAATPTRVIPWRGVPEINPNWTDDEDTDVGSIDPALPPYRVQTDITIPYTGTANYEDLPLIFAAGLIGGVTPTGAGAARTWNFEAESLVPTELDYFTDEFSDDVTQDGMRLRDVILENFELSFDESLGPWQFSGGGRAGNVEAPITPIALEVGSNFHKVFGADTEVFIDDTAAAIGTRKLENAVHGMTIRVEPTVDQKRFANGSNSRFALAGYGISARVITFSLVLAKTDQALEELVDWLNADPVNRFVRVAANSVEAITGSTKHSVDIRFSGTWRTRGDGEVGGNTTVTLEMTGRYDATLGYPMKATVVTGMAQLP